MNFRSLEIADEHNIHYVTDDFQVFNNSKQSEITLAVLFVVYSVNDSAALNYTLIVLQLRNPFITGFYLVKSNPDLTNFWNYL